MHPQLNRLSDFSNVGPPEIGECFNGGPMDLNEACTTLAVGGESGLPPMAGLSASQRRQVLYYNVYPNLLLSLHPDYVLTHTVWPVGPDRSRIECQWLFTAEALARPGFDASPMVEFWDLTNRQDWALCQRVQQGTGSQRYRPGPYQPSEICVHAFDRWYAECMTPHFGAERPGPA